MFSQRNRRVQPRGLYTYINTALSEHYQATLQSDSKFRLRQTKPQPVPEDFTHIPYNLTFRGPCIVIYSYNKTNVMH